MSISYIMGFIVGVVLILALLAAIILFTMKMSTNKNEGFVAKYDERQNAARGTAFKWGFYTMMIGVSLASIYHMIFEGHEDSINPMYIDLLLLLIGLLVYASVSIWKNAYIGLNQTYKRSIITLGAIGVMNLGVGAMNLSLSFGRAITNLALGLMIVIICAEMMLKHHLDAKRASAEDADEDDEE